MAHTIKQKDRLIARVRRIKGQLEAIERALENEAPCADILRQTASVRGAVGGLTAQLLEEHLIAHVLEADSEHERKQGGDEMLEVIRTYMK
ncbi:metal/formaldehyde-sensitive transcriptional repressor [Bartonella sp. HY329]|uniref:metal/formaldehyde-sensitive transcriptional repressor n=1 Tax=unclassified Bartonella TaxID=2645622 RepID=UPI0021C76D76|nr:MULTISPECIES: metal/formaldehyde-sensitive transcriptional repressor [unclassified Bartonella]UXM94478.1 metal/formaldehyde-sensitive transcriptional repressor [Bartonella sp. HY329]UXN08802.1 metal/formaldehyde-sensitive transcriptional repressor [Bartonella sp. HY328]